MKTKKFIPPLLIFILFLPVAHAVNCIEAGSTEEQIIITMANQLPNTSFTEIRSLFEATCEKNEINVLNASVQNVNNDVSAMNVSLENLRNISNQINSTVMEIDSQYVNKTLVDSKLSDLSKKINDSEKSLLDQIKSLKESIPLIVENTILKQVDGKISQSISGFESKFSEKINQLSNKIQETADNSLQKQEVADLIKDNNDVVLAALNNMNSNKSDLNSILTPGNFIILLLLIVGGVFAYQRYGGRIGRKLPSFSAHNPNSTPTPIPTSTPTPTSSLFLDPQSKPIKGHRTHDLQMNRGVRENQEKMKRLRMIAANTKDKFPDEVRQLLQRAISAGIFREEEGLKNHIKRWEELMKADEYAFEEDVAEWWESVLRREKMG